MLILFHITLKMTKSAHCLSINWVFQRSERCNKLLINGACPATWWYSRYSREAKCDAEEKGGNVQSRYRHSEDVYPGGELWQNRLGTGGAMDLQESKARQTSNKISTWSNSNLNLVLANPIHLAAKTILVFEYIPTDIQWVPQKDWTQYTYQPQGNHCWPVSYSPLIPD